MGLWRNAEYVAVLTLMKGDSLIERLEELTEPKLFFFAWNPDNLVF